MNGPSGPAHPDRHRPSALKSVATPDPPSPLRRAGLAGIFVVLLLAAGVYVSIRLTELPFLRGPHGYVLTDPDSYMRWRLVQRALAGEGVRIPWIDDDNAPIGRFNEWTSPMTILGVGAVRTVEFVSGAARPRALQSAALILTPALGFAALIALGVLGWRAGGWPLALAWVVAWPVLEDVLAVTRPGFVDHHALHQLLTILVYGVCLHPGRRPGMTGVAGGFAAALLLWATASEGIVLLAPLGVLTMVQLGVSAPRPAHAPVFWRTFWLVALAGSTAALIFEFWPQPWHTRLELLGPWHVLILLLAYALTELLYRVRLTSIQLAGVAVLAAALIIVAALATHGFHLGALHAVQDPRFQAMTRVITEFQSFLAGPAWLPRLWGKLGLLPLVLPAALILVWRRGESGQRLVLAATLMLAALACWQARWISFLAPLLVMSAGLVVQRWLPRRPWLVVALPALATLGPCLHAANIARYVLSGPLDSARGPYSTWFALEGAADCVGALDNRPVLLAPWDAGGVLAGTGRVRVIGSQYWSNAAGCADTFELFTTRDPSRFDTLLRERQVRYILVPDLQTLASRIRECFFALHGVLPSPQHVNEAVLFLRVTSGTWPQVPCAELERYRPGWILLRLQ